MSYYLVVRTYTVTEKVITKAEDRKQAFFNAGLDENCVIVETERDQPMPFANSMVELDYVSEATKIKLG